MTEDKLSLDEAYAIRTPEDAVRYYREQAEAYDRSFAEALGYVAPQIVAKTLEAERGPDDTPVLDIGAGTGLVAEHLDGTVDGIDISAEMLAVAAGKRRYRRLIKADLTRSLDIPDASYGALVSSGTFTHGHVGPGVLPELLRIARPGALCCFGIKQDVYDAERFGSAFAMLVAEGRITPLRFRAFDVYQRRDHPHGEDLALVAIFRTAR